MDVLEPPSPPFSNEENSSNPPTNIKPANGTTNDEEEGSRKREERKKRTALEEWQDGNQIPDWLHGKNPLNASESLTEWMLLALMEKLEMELAELRRKNGNTAIE